MDSASGTKVLLVDDDEGVLTATKRLLGASQPDWQILTAIDGREALELAAQHDIAVVVTDLNMPHTDGAELLRQLAESHPGTVRIVHSSQVATSIDPARTPAHRVLNKPAAPAYLLAMVRWGVRQSMMMARVAGRSSS